MVATVQPDRTGALTLFCHNPRHVRIMITFRCQTTRLALSCLLIATTLAHDAIADATCVICYDPPGVYRCQVSTANMTQQGHLACLQQIAAEGGHGSCSIRRGMTASDCDGPIKTIVGPAAPIQTPSIAKGGSAAPASEAPASGEPPRTVAEAARRAKNNADSQLKATEEQLRSSGEKTGGALKRSWDCMLSLFKKCGSEQD